MKFFLKAESNYVLKDACFPVSGKQELPLKVIIFVLFCFVFKVIIFKLPDKGLTVSSLKFIC